MLDVNEKKAFFLNLYNACLFHGYVRNGIPSNMMSRLLFFGNAGYNIGGLFYSLNDMEHGILRGNKAMPGTGNIPFLPDDPRIKHVCVLDPRIHFALVCGAQSCPPIRIFTSENLDEALEKAAYAFIQGGNVEFLDDEKTRKLGLSKIFEWYKDDFGGTDEKCVNYCMPYLGQQMQAKIRSSPLQIVHMEYNWESNSV
jgi:hypothetical protein